jgi:tetratricopeptide (TPR) repeat protein
MLAIAAVVGRRFRARVLEVVGAEGLAALLAEAASAGVVIEDSERGAYQFSHMLIRDALYEELPVEQRRVLHRRVGEAIERLPDHAQFVAELAHHFRAAAEGDGSDKAVLYALRAGQRAVALLAFEEAVRLYQLGLDLLERAPVETPDQRRKLCTLLIALAEAQRSAGMLEPGKVTAVRAATLARALGDADLMARAALAHATKNPWGEEGATDTALVELLEQTLAAYGPHDSDPRARLLARLALALRYERTPDRRIAASERALAMARRLGDPRTLACALGARHVAHWAPDNTAERLAIASELIDLARRSADDEVAFWGRYWRMHDRIELGDGPGADADRIVAQQLSEQLREPTYTWMTGVLSTSWAMREGRFGEAEQSNQDALRLGTTANSGAGQVFAVQTLDLHRTRGDRAALAGMADTFAALLASYPDLTGFRAVVMLLYLEADRVIEARAEFERLAAAAFTTIPFDQNWLMCMGLLAEVCTGLSDVHRAEQLHALIAPYRSWAAVNAGVTDYMAPVAHYLGMLATLRSCWDDAAAYFEAALEMNTRMHARPWSARTQYEYAAMLRSRDRPGDVAQARDLVARALDTARQLDMPRLIERAAALEAELALGDGSDRRDGPHRFVGRMNELATLRTGVDDAIAGHGRVVLLIGDFGMGKTHLAERLPEYARRRGAAISWGRCLSGEAAPLLWPWVQVLRASLREPAAQAQWASLIESYPEMSGFLQPSGDPPKEQSDAATESPRRRFRRFDAIVRYLAAQAAVRPQVLILDDLHAADQPSLLLLEFLNRHVRTFPIFVLGTLQSDALVRGSPITAAVVELMREPMTGHLELPGLNRSEVGHFLNAVAGGDLPAATVERVHELTGGNPLYVAEFGRSLRSHAQHVETAEGASRVPVPSGITAIHQARLAPLAAADRAVLRTAALDGEEFRLDHLTARIAQLAADGQASDQASAASVRAQLDRAIAAGLLVGTSDPPAVYRFAHPLLRETLYEEARANLPEAQLAPPPPDANRNESVQITGAGEATAGADVGVGAPAPAPAANDVLSLPATSNAARFVREGEFWTIEHDGRVVRLKHRKGVLYLVHLLRNPGQELLALDLINAITPATGRASRHPGGQVAGAHRSAASANPDVGPRLDGRARSQYKQRLEELAEALDEAEQFADLGRAERVRREINLISEQLAAAVGFAGRRRGGGSDIERARSAVTKRVRETIRRIADGNPELARHLNTTVKTGYICSYQPLGKGPSWSF